MFLTVVTTGAWSGIVSFDGLRDINVSVCRGLDSSQTNVICCRSCKIIDNIVGYPRNKIIVCDAYKLHITL